MINRKLVLFLLLALSLPFASQAADYLPKDSASSGNVVVSGDSYRNLYVGGSNVSVNSPVAGDLFAGGGSINVSAEVEDDLFVAGGNITINAPVSGDVRIAGGNIVINAPIAGDLLVAGGTVTLGEGATIGGDLWIAGGNISLNSKVSGNLKIYGEEVVINSEVVGKSDISTTKKLTLGKAAILVNEVIYRGKSDPIIETGAQVGTIERKTDIKTLRDEDDNYAGAVFFKTLILFVTLIVLWKLFTTQTTRLVDKTTADFVKNLLWGIAGLILIPLVAFLFMFTILGLAVGIIILISYFILIMASAAVSLLVIGKYVEKILRQDGYEITSKTFIWGIVGYLVLGVIPVVGSILSTASFLAVFGAVLKTLKAKVN